MAVTPNAESAKANNKTQSDKDFKGRHFIIGTNVAISIIMAIAIVGLVQWGSYYKYAKADLTDHGVNSLTPGTERLVAERDFARRPSVAAPARPIAPIKSHVVGQSH